MGDKASTTDRLRTTVPPCLPTDRSKIFFSFLTKIQFENIFLKLQTFTVNETDITSTTYKSRTTVPSCTAVDGSSRFILLFLITQFEHFLLKHKTFQLKSNDIVWYILLKLQTLSPQKTQIMSALQIGLEALSHHVKLHKDLEPFNPFFRQVQNLCTTISCCRQV